MFLLSPESAGLRVTLTQDVRLQRGSTRFEGTAVVEISSEAVTVVGLGPLGNRMLSLRWDGKRLERDLGPTLPKDFPAELIVRDLQLVYWPEQAIRRALPAGWDLKASSGRRALMARGKAIISIRYQGDPFRDAVEFTNSALGYGLTIKTLDYGHD